MAWYLWLIIGLFIGYVIKDLISPEIVIKGKIKQKGRGNNLVVKPDRKSDKKPRKRLFKRKKK